MSSRDVPACAAVLIKTAGCTFFTNMKHSVVTSVLDMIVQRVTMCTWHDNRGARACCDSITPYDRTALIPASLRLGCAMMHHAQFRMRDGFVFCSFCLHVTQTNKLSETVFRGRTI